LVQQQQFENARTHLRTAAKAEPKNLEIAVYLAWTEFMCDPAKAEDAKNALKELRKEKEVATTSSYFLGRIALHAQDYASAKSYFEAVIAREPKHAEAQRDLRLVKARMEEAEENKTLLGRIAR